MSSFSSLNLFWEATPLGPGDRCSSWQTHFVLFLMETMQSTLFVFLTLDRLEAYYAPLSFVFFNNFWTAADVDMKLGIPLRTAIIRRSMPKKVRLNWATKLRYSQFRDVTSRDFGPKNKCLKIRQKYIFEENCKKMHIRSKLNYLGMMATWWLSRICEILSFDPSNKNTFWGNIDIKSNF